MCVCNKQSEDKDLQCDFFFQCFVVELPVPIGILIKMFDFFT